MEDNSVIYEVNIRMQKDIVDSYNQWVVIHMKQLLEIDGFLSATYRKVEDVSEENFERYSAIYVLESREKLDNYIKNMAPKMRQDAIDRFGDKFTVDRRIMTNVQFLKK
jgi:hypothetical protein